MREIATVKYRAATSTGRVKVNCLPHDEDERVIAKAKQEVINRTGRSLPFGSESWKVVERISLQL